MTIKYIEPQDVTVPRYHRALKPWALEGLKRSRQDHGYNIAYAIILDGQNILVDGRHRLEAASACGIKSVPCVLKPDGVSSIQYRMQLQRCIQTTVPNDAPLERLSRMSIVSFVTPGEQGLIKLGHTTDIRKRLCALQMGAPVPLRLIAAIPGDCQLEHSLHKRFGEHLSDGEWFSPDSELVDFATLHPEELVNV